MNIRSYRFYALNFVAGLCFFTSFHVLAQNNKKWPALFMFGAYVTVGSSTILAAIEDNDKIGKQRFLILSNNNEVIAMLLDTSDNLIAMSGLSDTITTKSRNDFNKEEIVYFNKYIRDNLQSLT